MKIFYFSDYIKPAVKRIEFIVVVIVRFFKILFRRRKGIKLLHLSYAKKYLFSNSYLVIRYRFKNALWYNFRYIKKTTEKEIFILDLKNSPEMPVELVVHGFFRKKIVLIAVAAENTMESTLLRIGLKNRNNLTKDAKTQIANYSKFTVTIPNIHLKYPRVKPDIPIVWINHSSFSQTDFI